MTSDVTYWRPPTPQSVWSFRLGTDGLKPRFGFAPHRIRLQLQASQSVCMIDDKAGREDLGSAIMPMGSSANDSSYCEAAL